VPAHDINPLRKARFRRRLWRGVIPAAALLAVPSFAFPLPLRAGTKISAARRTQLRMDFEEARGASPLRHARIFFVGPKLLGPCPHRAQDAARKNFWRRHVPGGATPV